MVDVKNGRFASMADACMLACMQAEHAGMEIEEEGEVGSYMALLQGVLQKRGDLRAMANTPKHVLPFLQPGRLVRVLCPPGAPPPPPCLASSGFSVSQLHFSAFDYLKKASFSFG